WVGHRTQPVGRHFEHAQLADCPKPVLHRAHNAMRMMTLSLEVEHSVDDMLQCLRSREASIFRHMADQEHRNVPTLRCKQQLSGRLANLADAPGSGLEFEREDRLDRIDDDEGRLDASNLVQYPFQTRFGEQEQWCTTDVQALAARFDLV